MSTSSALRVAEAMPRGALQIVAPAATIDEWKASWDSYQAAKAVLIDPAKDVQTFGQGENAEKFLKKSYWRKASTFFALDVVLLREEEREIACDPDRCPADCKGRHYEVVAVARATHSGTGRVSDGDGSSIDNEKWGASRPLSGKQMAAIVKFGKRSEATAARVRDGITAVSNGRTSSLRELTATEASALMDWLYDRSAIVRIPRPVRNSRHNVRSTAVTRAKNRAISDLIGGGEVSAEEVDRGQHDEPQYSGGDAAPDVDWDSPADEANAGSPGAATPSGAQTYEPPQTTASEAAQGGKAPASASAPTGERKPMPAGMPAMIEQARQRAGIGDDEFLPLVGEISLAIDDEVNYDLDKLSFKAGQELLKRVQSRDAR